MKNFKKVLALVLSVVMMLGTFTMTFAAEGTGNEKVDKLVELELVKGDARGYRLEDPISRAETTVMLVRAKGEENSAIGMMGMPSMFPDVANHWAKGYVNFATGASLVKGDTAGTFRPDANITYAEVAAMLIRVLDGMTADEVKTAVWPYTYITKATELGIFAGVTGIDYNATAQREKVFEMVYNAITHKDANLLVANTIEGIVVENYRTESLNKDEVIVHVMKDQVQRSDASKYYEAGDEYKLTLTAELKAKGLDVETLLGKVVTISADKAGKVIEVVINNDYQYLQGALADVTAKDIKLAGKYYTVGKEEARADFDERLYQVYSNNSDITYDRFARSTEAEYAKITVRNGKVLFIDAFQFEDIAPVAKDIDKNKVAYYDDFRDGEVRTLEVKDSAYVINFENGEVNLGSNADIEANDVIHWFTDSRKNLTVFVRPAADNAVEGRYEDTSAVRATGGTELKIKVDKVEYNADVKDAKRDPVVATVMSSLEFEKLTSDYRNQLNRFEKTDVVLLRDMFNKVQLVASENPDGTFYAMVVQVLNNEFRLLKGDNVKDYYTTNIRNTEFKYVTATGRTEESKKVNIDLESLVKVTAEDDLLKVVTLIAGVHKPVSEFTKNFITIDGTTYYTSASTIVFIEDGTKSKAMDVATFLKDYKNPDETSADNRANLDAYVAENGKDKKVADVIVIEKATEKKSSLNTIVAKVDRVWVTGMELRFKTAAGETFTYPVTGTDAKADVLANKIVAGTIVKLGVTKTDNPDIETIEVLLADKAVKTYKVTGKGTNVVYLDGVEHRVAIDADIFGEILKDVYVSIVGTPSLVTVIDVRKEYTAPVTPVLTGVVTYINENRIIIDGVRYALDADSTLYNKDGKSVLALGGEELADATVIDLVNATVKDVKVKNGVITEMTLVETSAEANDADKAEAQRVFNLLGDFNNPSGINATNLDAQKVLVEKAREAYDALTPNQLVEFNKLSGAGETAAQRVTKLEGAEEKIANLELLAEIPADKKKDLTSNNINEMADVRFKVDRIMDGSSQKVLTLSQLENVFKVQDVDALVDFLFTKHEETMSREEIKSQLRTFRVKTENLEVIEGNLVIKGQLLDSELVKLLKPAAEYKISFFFKDNTSGDESRLGRLLIDSNGNATFE